VSRRGKKSCGSLYCLPVVFASDEMGKHHRGRTAGDPTAPAPIPACGVPALGSSGIRAAAVQPRPAPWPLSEADAR
jgi:hypothetical protein